MNQDNNCAGCNFRIFGSGCTKTGKRVTDHESCNKWEPIDNRSKNDTDALTAYFKAGYILKIEGLSA